MTYRDDRDALHARNDALEAEVAHLREQLDAERTGREPLRFVIEHARPKPSLRVAGALLAASAAAFALVMMVRGGSHHERPSRAPSPRTAVATWDAKVSESDSPELPIGTACTVESTLRIVLGEARPSAPVVRCNGRGVYDPADPRTLRLAEATFAVGQRVAPAEGDGSHVAMIYDLLYDEQRASLPRLSLDTEQGVGMLSSDHPDLHVQLQITPGSRPVVPSF